jgi:inner membrane protein
MDNFSHSVAGLAVGEVVHRCLPEESTVECNRVRHRLLLISGWLASNFPDLDLVLTPLLPEPLGYLLHHRGHTHTLLYAVPQALSLCAVLWALWPAARRLLKQSAVARTGLALTVGISLALHLLMDYLNSYGIHPFHPLDARWFYGDMVFIVEPLFWIVFGIPLIMTIRRNSMKILFCTILIGALLFFALREFLPWTSFGALLLLALVVGALQVRADDRSNTAFAVSAAIAIAFVGIQGFASHQARQSVRMTLNGQDPRSVFLDASMTSFPSNPLCWNFVSVERKDAEGVYKLRRGIVSLAPALMPVTECPARFANPGMKNPADPRIAFYAEEAGSLNLLRELSKSNCHFNAWMRFARAPMVSDDHASDVRFSSSPRGNFTTIYFDQFKGRACPRFIPEWDMPRLDLVRPFDR